jgi:hypothetical protein
MGVKLVSASGGSVEINPPTTASNFTATMPAATGNVVLDSATQSFTNKSFDSALVATVSGTAPIYMCRAWVNFNGTGTVAIRASGNVSSITDNGTGNYTVNFTTALADANYSVTALSSRDASTSNIITQIDGTTFTSSACRIRTFDLANGGQDALNACVSIFR